MMILEVVIIGTSLSRTGFSNEKSLTEHFSTPNNKIGFTKVTIGAASAKELEPAVIKSLENKVDLLLIEVNPWSLSFGSGHNFTHHRRWISTVFQSYFGITPTRYNQNHRNVQDTGYIRANIESLNKFKGFYPEKIVFSDLTQSAITKHSQDVNIKFFYPNWSKHVSDSKGLKWLSHLENVHKEISKETGIKLLPSIRSMNSDHYTDLVHPNVRGSEVYILWLEKVINEHLNYE